MVREARPHHGPRSRRCRPTLPTGPDTPCVVDAQGGIHVSHPRRPLRPSADDLGIVGRRQEPSIVVPATSLSSGRSGSPWRRFVGDCGAPSKRRTVGPRVRTWGTDTVPVRVSGASRPLRATLGRLVRTVPCDGPPRRVLHPKVGVLGYPGYLLLVSVTLSVSHDGHSSRRS